MKYTNHKVGIRGIFLVLCALQAALAGVAAAQTFGTTTVQGTVYTANGAPASGTLQLSWPAFTTAASQAVAAGRTPRHRRRRICQCKSRAQSRRLARRPLLHRDLSYERRHNQHRILGRPRRCAGHHRPGPRAGDARRTGRAGRQQGLRRPIHRAMAQSQITPSGGTYRAALPQRAIPHKPCQAADKHYVDSRLARRFPSRRRRNGPAHRAATGRCLPGRPVRRRDFGAKLQACISEVERTYGGTCDARNFTGTLAMGSNMTISTAKCTSVAALRHDLDRQTRLLLRPARAMCLCAAALCGAHRGQRQARAVRCFCIPAAAPQ